MDHVNFEFEAYRLSAGLSLNIKKAKTKNIETNKLR